MRFLPGLLRVVFTLKGSLIKDLLLENVRNWQVSTIAKPPTRLFECEIHSIVPGRGKSSAERSFPLKCTSLNSCFPKCKCFYFHQQILMVSQLEFGESCDRCRGEKLAWCVALCNMGHLLTSTIANIWPVICKLKPTMFVETVFFLKDEFKYMILMSKRYYSIHIIREYFKIWL